MSDNRIPDNAPQSHGNAHGDSQDNRHNTSLGIAGSMANSFIRSPLSVLLFLAMLITGIIGLIATPRQEDPQISVPMIDILLNYPGASAQELSSLAVEPLERVMSEIPGVKHVYAAIERERAVVTVRFKVGELLGPSLVKLHAKLQANADLMPPGVLQPIVRPVGIDDVPVVTLTLWSDSVDDAVLRRLSLTLLQDIKRIPDTGRGFVVGGRREQLSIEVLPERLSGFGLSLDQVAETIRTANSERQTGFIEGNNQHFMVYTGGFLRSPADIEQLVVASFQGAPIYIRDIASVRLIPEDYNALVNYYTGAGAPSSNDGSDEYADEYTGQKLANGEAAVTIAVAKKEGSNGVTVANAIIQHVESLRGRLIPDNVQVAVTRDYGASASDKVNGLLFKLIIATGAVTILVFIALGLRPAIVVTLVIPLVLLMTVFGAFLMGMSIDRVSLFALIFSIGILVDDAIVVVENIYRRWLEEGQVSVDTAVDAVREVGNPTIIATLTVVAALLPMGAVRGLMGPYMSPIPALGSVAMLISLFAAFVFVPWLAYKFRPSMASLKKAAQKEHASEAKLDHLFRRILGPILDNKKTGWLFLGGLLFAFFLSVSMFPFNAVPVKMLPFDNKPEFSIVVDMPEGTALSITANITRQIAEELRQLPEAIAVQTYAGTAKPFDFNGLVRHYYLRNRPWQAEVQIQLTHKSKRERSSHEIAVWARQRLQEMQAQAREDDLPLATGHLTIVEMPPGPPVLQTVVAEIYGPNAEIRRQVATDLTAMFKESDKLADIDNSLQEPYQVWRFQVDTEKAVRRGVSTDTIVRNMEMAMGGFKLGDIKRRSVLEPTYIVIQVPLSARSKVNRLAELPILSSNGHTVPLGELGEFIQTTQDPIIYHKDLRPLEYVVGDAVGKLGAPIYPMFEIEDKLKNYTTPDGVQISGEFMSAPADNGKSGFEWGGEWTVTFETFRDMGLAFGIALILIYILVVWEFGNFVLPAVIMAPIPLTLLGIVPGHWIMGAEFTATSMIGFIALAGIIVRNSILLVDFSIAKVTQGETVREAVLLACKARTRPIVITALALVAGSSVILTDPIFQGMAVSLLFGVIVSTLLTLVVIPLGCVSAGKYLTR